MPYSAPCFCKNGLFEVIEGCALLNPHASLEYAEPQSVAVIVYCPEMPWLRCVIPLFFAGTVLFVKVAELIPKHPSRSKRALEAKAAAAAAEAAAQAKALMPPPAASSSGGKQAAPSGKKKKGKR